MKARAAVATGGLGGAALLALTACDPVSRVDRERWFMAHCASCHGADGTGDGPVAAALDPPPADLTTIAQRNGGDFPFAEVMAVIDGYDAPSRQMPAFSDLLAAGETVPFDIGDGRLTPTPAPLIALTEHVRSLQAE